MMPAPQVSWLGSFQTELAGASGWSTVPTPRNSPRKRGRPKVQDEAYFRQVWSSYVELLDWFVAEFGRTPKSDAELVTSYFKAGLEAAGLSMYRLNTVLFKRRLKTIRNQITAARTLERTNPAKSISRDMPAR